PQSLPKTCPQPAAAHQANSRAKDVLQSLSGPHTPVNLFAWSKPGMIHSASGSGDEASSSRVHTFSAAPLASPGNLACQDAIRAASWAGAVPLLADSLICALIVASVRAAAISSTRTNATPSSTATFSAALVRLSASFRPPIQGNSRSPSLFVW